MRILTGCHLIEFLHLRNRIDIKSKYIITFYKFQEIDVRLFLLRYSVSNCIVK